MPAKRKQYTITAGMHKGKKCFINPGKKTKSSNDQIEVNIIEGPIINISPLFIK